MADTKLVIAFDARIGNLEAQMQRLNTRMRKTQEEAGKTQGTFGRLGDSMRAAGQSAAAAAGGMGRLLGMFGVGLGLTAAISGFMRLADAVGNLGEQADQAGVTVESLQAWRAIGVQFNVTQQEMDAALARFTRTMGEAAEGNEEAAAKFVRAGISIRDTEGNLRQPREAFRDLADSIAGLDNPAERAARAVDFLGKAGQRLIPILVDMGEKQVDVVTRARDMGQVISTEVSSSFDKFGDSLAEFSRRIYVFIANALAPLAEAIGNIFSAMNRTLTLSAQASRIRAGEGTAGDLERAQQIRDRQREAQQAIEADIARRSTGPGRLTERELRPYRERLEAARALTQRYENEVTRIEGLAQAERQRRTDEAGRAQAEAFGRLNRSLEEEAERAAARAEATRRGPAALREFEIQESARQAAQTRFREAERQGIVLTDAQRQAIEAQTLAIARNNAVRAASGSGNQDLGKRIQEAAAALDRLGTQNRTPLETLESDLARISSGIAVLQQNAGRLNAQQREALAGVNYEDLARAAESAAERTAKALQEAGASTQQVTDLVGDQVRRYAEELVRIGVLTEEQLANLQQRAGAAVDRAINARNSGDFMSGLRSGFGLSDGRNQTSFGEAVGAGVGREIVSGLEEVFDILNKVAEGSVKAGDAFRQLAVTFTQSVAKIIAQAALLKAVEAIFGYLTGGTGSTFKVAGGFGGPKMAGGVVSSGYTYLVGERGPELFTAPGSGRITPNNMLAGGGMNVVVNQNAPGVMVESRQVDEQTVMLAVNLSRQRVADDFKSSNRTGYGPYAETLTSRYNLRRRL